MEFLTSFLPKIQHLGVLGYLAVFFISFAESLPFIGLLVPGTVLITLFGFFSAQGYLNIWVLIGFSAAGAILGDGVSYYLGTRGTKLFRQENKILKLSHLERGQQFFKKHGDKSIFLGRFIGPLRPIIPFVAGLFRMDKKVFLFWNVTSGILWSVSFLLLGYFFSGALKTIETWSSRVGLSLLGVVIFAIVIRILAKYALSVKRDPAAASGAKNFIARHPALSSFVRSRLDKQKFSGLPLTLLAAAFACLLILLLVVINGVFASGAIASADTRLANFLFSIRDGELIRIFTWITLLGKWQIVVSSALVVSAILRLWRKSFYLLPFWVTIAGSSLFNFFGKLAFHRARPDVAFYVEDTFSFPSGHATIAVAFYGFLTYLAFRLLKKPKYKIVSLFLGTVIIVAIGLSRLYLGVHFLSDVWGGYLLGALWLLIGITASELLRRGRPLPASPPNKAKLLALILILAEIIFYVSFGLRYNPPIVRPAKANVIVAAVLPHGFLCTSRAFCRNIGIMQMKQPS